MDGATRRSFVERNRFGRVGRIPTPLPAQLPVSSVNAYLLFPPAGGGSLTMIDTGVHSPEAFEALRQGLKEFGWSFEHIERILITHAHLDHYGQARRIREISGAKVYASAIEAEKMRRFWSPRADRNPQVRVWFRRWGVPDELGRPDPALEAFTRKLQDPLEVDGTLADGDRLSIGDLTLEVIATPGHCEGHVVYYEPELRILFSGDHLLPDITPVPLLAIPEREDEPRPKSLLRFMDSLARVEKLECEMVFPAHGDVIVDHRKLIAGYRLHHERRKLQMLRALRGGPRTPFELARRLFSRHVEHEIFLVMSEVIGHLDLLAEEGEVEIEQRDGVWWVHRTDEARGAPKRAAQEAGGCR